MSSEPEVLETPIVGCRRDSLMLKRFVKVSRRACVREVENDERRGYAARLCLRRLLQGLKCR